MHSAIDLGDVGRRFCDLVMKGGITSGVVFPSAVARLSRQYRFRNIGGTSAGAIAAAATAAAEFRRSTDALHADYAFTRLGELARYLGERPDGKSSRLFRLFRPEAATRRHFAILAAMLNRGGPVERALHGAGAAVRYFPFAAIVGAAPGTILIAAISGTNLLHVVAMTVAALFIVLGAATSSTFAAAVSLVRTLPKQDFGLARGHATNAGTGDQAALTDWLHVYLQDLAGKAVDAPLTFGDLDGVVLDEQAGIRGINLQMMTTALTMGRPFSLPFSTEQFYFDADEIRRYFPDEIVDWMIAHPGARTNANRARDQAMLAFGFMPLPTRDALPVIVAVRLSLSFPFLLSGVPLYRYAWESIHDAEREEAEVHAAGANAQGTDARSDPRDPIDPASAPRTERFIAANVRKVLFSDGGICSNFPVHLFDAVLPGWPTFGINLRDDLPADAGGDERAYLPDRGRSLAPEEYDIAWEGNGAVLSFAAAIIRTMQNWRDNLQRAAPGFRDRVVTVRHKSEEGGLNLDMAARDIRAMAESGDLAARKLIDAFGQPDTLDDDGFTYHRWVRVRSLLAVTQRVLREIHDGVTVLENHPPYPDLLRDAPFYVGASYRLSETARTAAAQLLDTLDRLQHDLAAAHVEYARTAPRPEVELRIQPVW